MQTNPEQKNPEQNSPHKLRSPLSMNMLPSPKIGRRVGDEGYVQTGIEAQLRASAPSLPPELRPRILQECRNTRRNKPAFGLPVRWRLAGAFGSFVLLCWLAGNSLDAQNQALLAGNSGRQSTSLLALHANTAPPTQADAQSFGVALRRHLRQMALLLHDKHSG